MSVMQICNEQVFGCADSPCLSLLDGEQCIKFSHELMLAGVPSHAPCQAGASCSNIVILSKSRPCICQLGYWDTVSQSRIIRNRMYSAWYLLVVVPYHIYLHATTHCRQGKNVLLSLHQDAVRSMSLRCVHQHLLHTDTCTLASHGACH